MMSIQYAKKQVLESIKYWMKVLEELDESAQTLLMKLEKAFGKDLVSNQQVDLTLEQFEKIYKILNVFIFDNRLDHIPIRCMLIDDIINELHRLDEVEEISYQDYSSKRKSYGFYANAGDIDESLPENQQIFSLKYRDHMIFLNMSKCNGLSFIKQVAVLCHEMIHYYDALYGQYKKFHQIEYLQKREKDDHLTLLFKQKKKEAREMGIPVSSFMDDSWKELSDEEFMKKIEQVDESTLLAPPLSALKSTEYTKIGKKSIRFMSYGDL